MNEAGEIENFRRATRKGLNPHSLDNLVHEGTMHSYYPVLDGNDKCSLTISHFLHNAKECALLCHRGYAGRFFCHVVVCLRAKMRLESN